METEFWRDGEALWVYFACFISVQHGTWESTFCPPKIIFSDFSAEVYSVCALENMSDLVCAAVCYTRRLIFSQFCAHTGTHDYLI